jgi:hypothetical protein
MGARRKNAGERVRRALAAIVEQEAAVRTPVHGMARRRALGGPPAEDQ